jgi:hypothetical protein
LGTLTVTPIGLSLPKDAQYKWGANSSPFFSSTHLQRWNPFMRPESCPMISAGATYSPIILVLSATIAAPSGHYIIIPTPATLMYPLNHGVVTVSCALPYRYCHVVDLTVEIQEVMAKKPAHCDSIPLINVICGTAEEDSTTPQKIQGST